MQAKEIVLDFFKSDVLLDKEAEIHFFILMLQ
jgi:hypothetical protein